MVEDGVTIDLDGESQSVTGEVEIFMDLDVDLETTRFEIDEGGDGRWTRAGGWGVVGFILLFFKTDPVLVEVD